MMYEQRNADILERQQRVTELEAKVARTKEELSKKKGELIRKAREQSAAMVRRTRRESEAIIKELKEQFDDQGIKRRQQAIQDARAKLNEAFEKSRPGIMAQKGVGKAVSLKSIKPGDIVYVKKLDQKGTVLEVQGKELTVQIAPCTRRSRRRPAASSTMRRRSRRQPHRLPPRVARRTPSCRRPRRLAARSTSAA